MAQSVVTRWAASLLSAAVSPQRPCGWDRGHLDQSTRGPGAEAAPRAWTPAHRAKVVAPRLLRK